MPPSSATTPLAPAALASRFADDARFAREVAERAGDILRDRYERVGEVSYKSEKDVVTEVDHLSEALILGAIRERFPTDGILAEESGEHRGRASTRRGDSGNGAEADRAEAAARSLASGRTWIVDPLDGTVNYANGLPLFCVSVALVVDGRPTVGVVHEPLRRETFWATADGPAMLGDRALAVSAKDKSTDLVLQLALAGRAVASRARAVRKAVRVTRNIGSSALAFTYVAAGRFDAAIQTAGMSSWDIAAAGLIAERAGAVVTDAEGGPWFDVARATRTFGCLAAPPAHHAELLRLSRQPVA
ncbi:MAG TPA: inositol monophosphatase family protein [Candidatus Limnocylindrales bacterium]